MKTLINTELNEQRRIRLITQAFETQLLNETCLEKIKPLSGEDHNYIVESAKILADARQKILNLHNEGKLKPKPLTTHG